MKLNPVQAGFVAALLGASLFYVYTRRYETETAGGDRVDVLVSSRRIERGTVVTDDYLTTRSIPQAYVDDRTIRASDREKILGLRASESVPVAQNVLWSDVIATRDDKRELSALVQPGYRGVTAPFTASSLIRPGNFVDVLLVVSRTASDEKDSIVLLQRVLVLAVGGELGSAIGGKGEPSKKKNEAGSSVLTLSLNIPEAQLLSLAAQRGTLSAVVRNDVDVALAEAVSDLSTDSLTSQDKRKEVAEVRKRAPAPVAAPRGPVKLENKE